MVGLNFLMAVITSALVRKKQIMYITREMVGACDLACAHELCVRMEYVRARSVCMNVVY